ncbi:MAG: Hsp20/alpha crystallin family protein [Nitrospirae bacterium]|nr:MAG: Hsp20/alpha crystallin family protein [Nitrospirota bacterium]
MDRWDPLKDVFTLKERINKLFEDAHIRHDNTDSSAWAPAIDIYEMEGEYMVRADLPEVSDADINITVEENMLRISGRRKLVREGRNYYQVERAFGNFYRSFMLPSIIDKNSIKAALHDGVLKIVLPKKAVGTEDIPKHIEIK